MKILITGGAGFIGSHITDRLLQEGHHVVVLDNFSNGNKIFIPQNANVEKADITDVKHVDEIFKKYVPEAVFHCAAFIDVRKSIENPVLDYSINVAGGVNILEACAKYGVKKLIFSSSGGAIYGDASILPSPESSPVLPLSPYGASKASFEQFAYSFHHIHGLHVINLRYSNVYGPRQGTMGEGGVIGIFSKQILDKKPLIVFGSGDQTRDFVFVDDVVESNIKALEAGIEWGLYNVSTAIETSVNGILKALEGVVDTSLSVTYKDAISGEIMRSCLDNTLIKKELGWTPQTALPKGIEKTWKWFNEYYS